MINLTYEENQIEINFLSFVKKHFWLGCKIPLKFLSNKNMVFVFKSAHKSNDILKENWNFERTSSPLKAGMRKEIQSTHKNLVLLFGVFRETFKFMAYLTRLCYINSNDYIIEV